MANATKLIPLDSLTFVQLSRPSAENPRLSSAISDAATTLKSTYPLLDSDGSVITKAMFLGIRNKNSYTETCLVPTGSLNYDAQTAAFTVGSVLTGGTSGAKAIIVRDTDNGLTGTLDIVVYSGTFQNDEALTDASGGAATCNGTLTQAISADGLTVSGVVRGIALEGLDWITGDADLAVEHKEGDAIFCNISGVIGALIFAAIQGQIATGATGITIGTEGGAGNETITIYRTTTAGAKLGVFRWSTGSGKAEYSNDGAVWNAIDNVAAGSLVVVSADDDTPSNLEAKIVAGDGIDLSTNNPAGNETRQIDVDVTDLIDTNFGLTEDTNNIRVNLDADPGLEFNAGALRVKVKASGGISRTADGLSTDGNALLNYSGTSGEAIDGSATPQALCAIGSAFKDIILVSESGFGFSHEINFDWNSVPADVSMGDVDARARIAQAFTYVNADATITLESVSFFVKKNGTPADNIRVTIQTDTGGSIPDNTVIANGTSNNVSGGSLSTNYELTTFTFVTPPTLTYNQKYYFVLERTAALDAANYYIVGNANADRYSSHNRAVQTGSTATWADAGNNDFMLIARFNVDGSNQIFKGEADNGVRCNYVGVTEDNVAADAAISVTPPGGVNSSFAGLAGCAEYYLSTTAGAITANAPSAAGSAVISVGTTRNATTLEIAKGSKVYKVGLSNFVPEDAGNFDLYIPCGFKPKVVEVLWFLSDSDGGSNYDMTHAKFLTTSGADPTASLFKQLTAPGVITIGTSTITAGGSGSGGGSGDQTVVYPVSTFDNGVVMKFKNATTEFITQCDILLYG